MSSSASDSDDDAFAPFIPGLTPAPNTTVETQEKDVPPPTTHTLKRPRDDASDTQVEMVVGSPSLSQDNLARQGENGEEKKIHTVKIESMEDDAETRAANAAWDRYVNLGLPSASLYYRSFLHTSEPTPLLPESENESAHERSARSADAPTSVPQLIDDMVCIQDALGVLLCSVDAIGVVRLWRKLPRGIFFWGELDRIFGHARAAGASVAHTGAAISGDGTTTHEGRCRYYLRSCAEVQSLVCVRVEEVREPSTLAFVEVHVEMRLVNPYTLTVEGRRAFVFPAPVRDGQACYTPQPFLLMHKYDLYVALFTALVPSPSEGATPGASGDASTVSSPSSSPTLAQGAVVVPCQAAKGDIASTGVTSSSTNAVTQYLEPSALSVASRVVCCVQMSASTRLHKDQQGLLPCVLLCADGTVDYAVLDQSLSTSADLDTAMGNGNASAGAAPSALGSATALYARSGISLRVTGGLATCPPHSAEYRIWSQLVSFKRRANTDFFALLKLARTPEETSATACASEALPHATELAAVVVPTGASFVTNGQEFVVASTRVSLRAASPHSTADVAVYAQPCLHWFHFGSGKLRGVYVTPLDIADDALEVVPLHLAGANTMSTVVARWKHYVAQLRTSGHVGAACSPLVGLHVLPSACAAVAGGFEHHTFVPEVSPAELLPGLVSVAAAASASARAEGSSTVVGRQVRVYRAILATSPAERNESRCLASGAPGALSITPLKHAVGEMERMVRRGPTAPPAHASGTRRVAEASDFTAMLLSDVAWTASATRGTATVPLLLLASSVTPSQSLKNFITQSPVGASLSSDEVKQLLVAVPQRSVGVGPQQGVSAGSPSAYTDPLLCTSALGPATATALLLYAASPAEVNPATAATAQWLQKTLTSGAERGEVHGDSDSDDTALAGAVKREDETKSPSLIQRSMEVLEAHRVWKTVLQELAQRRQFACGDLLAGTNWTARPAATPLSTDADTAQAGDATEHDDPPSSSAETTTAASTVKAPASKAPITTLDERSQVMALLASALATLPPPETPAASSVGFTPKEHGLVHVRGYGTVRIGFLPRVAPLAVENFQRLARQNYYNGLTFHRVIPLTIVQGGCPRGDGTGGACIFEGQETFADENLDAFPFFSHTEHAWLCMANAGENTNGSQFFFTVPGGQPMPWLNGHHTVFGFVMGGGSLLTAISEVPRDEDDKPRTPIVMERIDIY